MTSIRQGLIVLAVAAAVGVPVAVLHFASADEHPPFAQTVTADGGISLSDWQGGEPAVGASVRADAQQVFESFAGTVGERDALSVVRSYQSNHAMDQCMAAAGYPEWDWSLSRSYADPDDPLKTNVWLAMPISRWRSHDLVAAKPFLQAEKQMNADETPAYSDAVSACDDSVRGQHDSTQRVEIPQAVERVTRQWWSFVGGFDAAALPAASVYVDCMNDADITMMGGEKPEFSDFGTAVGYAMSGASPADSAIPSDPQDAQQWDDPAWQRFLQLEDEFDQADWSCRQDVYAAHIQALGPAIDTFASEHADQIEQARQFWQDITDQAAALGYTGQTGSLEGQTNQP